ncbi:hypothetical protein ACFQX7_40170 [Luedemannella flava]
MTTGRIRRVAVTGLAVALLAACGAPDDGTRAAPAASGSLPRPVNVADPAVIPSVAAAPTCDARASLRPTGARPAPGAMPAGSTMARIVERAASSWASTRTRTCSGSGTRGPAS